MKRQSLHHNAEGRKTARWQGSQLVVVTQRANGSKLMQTYTLDQGAGNMIISTLGAGGAP